MKTIYQLQQIANRLRQVSEVNSISPEDTFGLQSDILEYLADMEQNAEGLGIHKVYASYAAMVADASAPVGSNGKALRFGQLVVIYNSANTSQAESGNVYAWQKGNSGAAAWLLMGNLGSVLGNPQNGYYVCDTAAATAEKEISATGYVLSVGGSMKVKMTNANTADNATLNINSTGVKALYYAGERASSINTWEAGETVEVYYDGTSYYANNVAGGSGSGDGVFDVSVKYPTSGVEGGNTYTLEGALSILNTNLPASKKKGGMRIQFIHSSDNKYVQYRYMGTATTGSPNPFLDTANWQGVDDKPTAGSDNLVNSGGVDKELEDYKLRVYGLSALPAYNGSVDGGGKIVANYAQARNKVVQVNGGETMTVKKGSNISRVAILRSYDYNRTLPYTFDYATGTGMLFTLENSSLITKELPSDARYIIFNVKNSSGDDCTPSVLTLNGIDLLKGLEDKTAFASGENVFDVNIVDSIESNNNGLPKSSSVYAANVNVKKETEMLVLDDATSLEGQIVGVATDFDFDSLKITRFINASASHQLIIVASVNGSDKEFTLLYDTNSGYYTGVKTYSKTREGTGTIKVVVRFNGKSYTYDSTELLINKSLVDRYEALDNKLESEINRATGIEGGLQTALTTISGKVDDLENAVTETEQISYNSTSTGDGVTQVNGFCRVDYETPRIAGDGNFHTIKFPVQNGDIIETNTSYGTATWGHILYDSNNAYLAKIRPDTNGTFTINNENAVYIAITWKLADVSLNEISAVLYRKLPLSDTVEELDSRVEYIENYINDIPVNHAYKGAAPAGIRNKLLNMTDDVNILLLGDSMTAFTNVGPVFENAANLPAGCQRDTFAYQLWDAICKNKPQCDRFDSAVNAFTETGTWALSNVAKQNISVNSDTEKGEFSPDNCVYHETAITNDSVAFSWNLDDYEKLNFIYRISAYDGTTEVTISCTSGKVVVYDRASSQWVEANGYTFSQTKTAATSKSDNVADWLRNIPLKMKRVANATGSVTLTFTNTGTGTMYYWGTERYNFNTVRITNIARGGRHIQLLQGNMADEISYRDIDLIICQLPLWNELKAGGDYNAQWDSRHIAFLDYLKSRSSNFADWQVIVNLYHTQVNDWIGNKNIQFQANGDTTKPKTTLPSWDCEMKTIASLNGYDNNVSVCNLVNEMYEFALSHDTTMQRILTAESQMSSSTEVDENAIGDFFTVDGVHLSQLGFKFYVMCIVPMMYD